MPLSRRLQTLRKQALARVHEVTLDRARLVTDAYRRSEGEPIILRRARAVDTFLRQAPLRLYDPEWLVGDRAWGRPAHWNYPDMNPWHTPGASDPARAAELEAVWSYWREHGPKPTCTSVKGHCVPGYERLLRLGSLGLRDEAVRRRAELLAAGDASPEALAFLDAEIVVAEAAAAWGARFAELARAAAAGAAPTRRRELLRIAEVCDQVPARPARSFHEAVQALWFGQLLVEAEDPPNAQSPGRLDQLLAPYYERDRAAGRITRRFAKELLSCLWLKYWAPYDVCDVVIGGQTPDGADAANELSGMFLEVQSELGLYRQLSVRWHRGLNRAFLRRCVDVVREGLGVPQFFNDDVLVPNLEAAGLPPTVARDYSIIGCIEMTPPGRGDVRAVVFWNNLPKCLEYVFTDGVCPQTGQRQGVATGDLASITSYDELVRRYHVQVEEEIRRCVESQYRQERAEQETYPMPVLSLLTEDCVARARDITAGGARYNSSMPCAVGVPNVADSLLALRTLVFEQRRFTLAEVAAAMRTDFEGCEPLRQALLHAAPKYGQDDDTADGLAAEVARHYCEAFAAYRDPRGGRYCPSLFSFTLCMHMGRQVGATPDGRKAGQPLANSLSPAEGHGPTSPTALLRSASSLPTRLATGGTSLLADLPAADACVRPDGTDPLLALLEGYFARGGTHIEFTLTQAEQLRAARQDPTRFPNLTVRVAGYSARFVDLSPEVQDHVIARVTAMSAQRAAAAARPHSGRRTRTPTRR